MHVDRNTLLFEKKEYFFKRGVSLFSKLHTGCFAGLTFLAWYIAGKVRAFNRRGHVAKLCIIFLPILVAALVGVSRVDDYWHHWQDVFAGAILGMLSHPCILLSSFYPNPTASRDDFNYFLRFLPFLQESLSPHSVTCSSFQLHMKKTVLYYSLSLVL